MNERAIDTNNTIQKGKAVEKSSSATLANLATNDVETATIYLQYPKSVIGLLSGVA